MKNKEIEELLNKIKQQLLIDERLGKEIAQDFHKTTLNYKEIKILLSYIEQLEQCYCNRTDCSSRIKDSKKYDSLLQKYKQLQNIIDKAIEILYKRKHVENLFGGVENSNTDKIINLLKGDSDVK